MIINKEALNRATIPKTTRINDKRRITVAPQQNLFSVKIHNTSWWAALLLWATKDFPGGSDGKESACNAGDLGSIPGSGRSPGEGHGNPPQYSCLENPMDRGAWWATVRRVAKSWTQLNQQCKLEAVTMAKSTAPPPFLALKKTMWTSW